jgi:hypothetical protein
MFEKRCADNFAQLLLPLSLLSKRLTGTPAHTDAHVSQAMDGSLSLEAALEERLKLINCTPADIQAFIKAHPPQSRLVPVSS